MVQTTWCGEASTLISALVFDRRYFYKKLLLEYNSFCNVGSGRYGTWNTLGPAQFLLLLWISAQLQGISKIAPSLEKPLCLQLSISKIDTIGLNLLEKSEFELTRRNCTDGKKKFGFNQAYRITQGEIETQFWGHLGLTSISNKTCSDKAWGACMSYCRIESAARHLLNVER